MPLPYEILIGLRYTLTGKHDRFVSFVSLMSAAGIALGVAALVVIISVMSGFHKELRGRILSVASHLEALSPTDGGFADWKQLRDEYLRHPEVAAAAPGVHEQGLLINGKHSQGALVRGIFPALENDVSDLADYTQEGDLAALTAGSFAVALGKRLAKNLQVGLNDDVLLIAPKGRLTAAGFYPRLRRLKVAAIFSSGLYQYDNGLAFMHIEDAQSIYRLNGATSIRLQIRDVMRAPLLRSQLSAARPDIPLYDWTTSHGGLFRALVVEKRAMFIILTLIIAVAAFNIVSALVTMVRNKRGDIAILRAMGATSGAIARVFLVQGLLIGVVGTVAGVCIGVPVALNVGDIVQWLENAFGRSFFPGSVYHLEKLPSIVSAEETLLVAAVALLLSLLATAYPAWYGSRLRPADSLRYE